MARPKACGALGQQVGRFEGNHGEFALDACDAPIPVPTEPCVVVGTDLRDARGQQDVEHAQRLSHGELIRDRTWSSVVQHVSGESAQRVAQ
jgi:hypothetical protein